MSKPITHLGLMLVGLLLSGCAAPRAAGRNASAAVPEAVTTLPAGWNRLTPGGGTSCADGSAYSFFVRPADTTRVLVFLQGGGACWNAEDCERRRTYAAAIPSDFDPRTIGGVLDGNNGENPFARYTMVVVPYCTGDLHLGDRDHTYSIKAPDATTRDVLIRHRGQRNVQAVLAWIHGHIRTPSQVVVVGASAGAFSAPVYGSRLTHHYPRARVIALGDAAGIHKIKDSAIDFGSWGLPEALRRDQGWESFPSNWGVPDLFVAAARVSPRLQLVQIDQAWDQNQGAIVARIGKSAADLPAMLRSNRAEITERVRTFRSFTIGGLFHTVTDNSAFYSYDTNGRRVRDWVAAIESGDAITSVDCTKCRRPGLRFSTADLGYVDAALGLLSNPNAWNPRDETGCAAAGDRYSLRCALQRAARTSPPSDAGFQEVFYTAMERLGASAPPADPAQFYNPIRIFNDRPGRTFEEITSLLQEVRARFTTHLGPQR